MLKQECVNSAPMTMEPVEVYYFPCEFQPGRWAVLRSWTEGTIEVDGEPYDLCRFESYRGRRTGRLVVFSRLSDAKRLCDVLNSNQE